MRTGIFYIIGFILGFTIVFNIFYYQTAETIEITVTDKERIVESSGESTTSKYLVLTETESFENTDDILYWKFNSTDYQRWLEEDSTYTVTVVGWRMPYFSMYRNIVDIERNGE